MSSYFSEGGHRKETLAGEHRMIVIVVGPDARHASQPGERGLAQPIQRLPASRERERPGDDVTMIIGGREAGRIAVADLLP